MPEEVWAEIPGVPEYAASSYGRIKRVVASRGRYKDRILTPSLNLKGYQILTICSGGERKTVTVHKLICMAFHGANPGGMEVAHFDGSRTNNRPENLRWATRVENFQDRDRHGRTAKGARSGPRLHPEKLRRGGDHPGAVLGDDEVIAIRQSAQTQVALAALFGVSQSTISDIKRRNIWRHI